MRPRRAGRVDPAIPERVGQVGGPGVAILRPLGQGAADHAVRGNRRRRAPRAGGCS